MSFLNNIFGNSPSKNNETAITWIPLNSLGQLSEIKIASISNPVIIFKHSTRCSISRMALKQFEKEYNLEPNITCYYLDLLNFRPISDAISTEFNLAHQSPQLLLIKSGVCTFSSSHESISVEDLKLKIV